MPQGPEAGASPGSRTWTLLVCLLLAVLGFILYWPATRYGFINIDDHVYFGENEHVLAGLSGLNLLWAFQTTLDASWYPLSWLSFMLDAQLFGRGPLGPHLTNILWHVANGILLFLFLRQLTGSIWRSGFAAALFALHPLHVESVAWISERKDVLSMFFGLLTLMAYTRYARAGANHGTTARRFYLLSLLLFMLGLLSKPMLVTLPGVLLLLDYWPLRRVSADPRDWFIRIPTFRTATSNPEYVSFRRLLLEKLPFVVLAFGASLVTVLVHHYAGAIAPVSSVSVAARVENAFVSYATYLRQTVWPTDLAMPYLHQGHWPLFPVMLSLVVVGGLSAGALWFGRRRPYLLVGWLWFLGTLVPVIGLIQWGNQAMADRFTYLPSVGLFIGFAWGLGELCTRWHLPRVAVVVGSVAVLAALGGRARNQLGYWRDSETLFRHTIQVTRGNYVAYDCVGSALERAGHTEEALRYLQEAVRLEPRYPEARYDLGTALLRKGELEEAVRHLTAAVKYNPTGANAYINLGKALLGQGKVDEAAAQLQAAVRLEPEDPQAHYNLGTVLALQGRGEAAIECYRTALKLNPAYAEAHGNLGVALMRKGSVKEGVTHLATASKLNPQNAEAHYNLGLALLEANYAQAAVEEFKVTVEMMPEAAGAHYHLALALTRQDKQEEARSHARKAFELAKATAQTNLAMKAEALLR